MHTTRDMLRTVFLMILYFLAILILIVVCAVYGFKLLGYISNDIVRILLVILFFGLIVWGLRSLSQKVVPKILDKDYNKDDYDEIDRL